MHIWFVLFCVSCLLFGLPESRLPYLLVNLVSCKTNTLGRVCTSIKCLHKYKNHSGFIFVFRVIQVAMISADRSSFLSLPGSLASRLASLSLALLLAISVVSVLLQTRMPTFLRPMLTHIC